jgi:hypothetical protein
MVVGSFIEARLSLAAPTAKSSIVRYAIPSALLALALATPAFATGGFVCSPVGAKEPVISLVIGHGIPGGSLASA